MPRARSKKRVSRKSPQKIDRQSLDVWLRHALYYYKGAGFLLNAFVVDQFRDEVSAKRFEEKLVAGLLPDFPEPIQATPPVVLGIFCYRFGNAAVEVGEEFRHYSFTSRVAGAFFALGQLIWNQQTSVSALFQASPVVSL